MTLEERMDKLERSLGANDALVRELRDAVTVTALLEAQQGRIAKDHANWLIAHDKAIESSRKEFNERMQALDERIEKLVSGIGEFMRRRNDAV